MHEATLAAPLLAYPCGTAFTELEAIPQFCDDVAVEEGINSFYGDSRNQNIYWYDAFKFFAMALNGDTPAEDELDFSTETRSHQLQVNGLNMKRHPRFNRAADALCATPLMFPTARLREF